MSLLSSTIDMSTENTENWKNTNCQWKIETSSSDILFVYLDVYSGTHVGSKQKTKKQSWKVEEKKFIE